MVVGTLELQIRLDGCHNLKDKRRILRSLIDRCRNDYRVAIAEVDDLELWNAASIGAACVSNNAVVVESTLQRVVDCAESFAEIEVECVSREIQRR